MERTAFGKRLEQIRIEKKLSLLKMANLCGIAVGHYSTIEAGTRNLSYDTLLRIADGLRIPLSDLVRYDKAPEYPKYDDETNNLIALIAPLPTDARKCVLKIVQSFSDFLG